MVMLREPRRKTGSRGWAAVAVAVAAAACLRGAAASAILETSGFDDCGGSGSSDVQVQHVNIRYDNDNKTVTFDVAGSSTRVQNVTAVLNVTAYGRSVYSNTFSPCAAGTFVEQLCPVPIGNFSARGSQAIPAQFANAVPAIAFQVPDLVAQATLQLRAADGGADVACVQADVSNGKTTDVPAVPYIAAGVAGAALLLAGISAISAAAAAAGGAGASGLAAGGGTGAGMGAPSPSFGEVVGWFQGMAMNSMLSVNYPPVYRSFAKNFGFSTGLVPWTQLQTTIDRFRAATGGNLTDNSMAFLQNTTLVFPDGTTSSSSGSSQVKRALDAVVTGALAQLQRSASPGHRRLARDLVTSINGTIASGDSGSNSSSSSSDGSASSGDGSAVRVAVHGIQAYVEALSIPSANTFMTVLLVVALVIAAMTVGILLVKGVLELWALVGRFPAALTGFRRHYWRSLARAITTLILLLYGIWVLYCVFQFTQGDSWAAKVLAGVTLGLFTGVLAYFAVRIGLTAQRLRREEGDARALYEDKTLWARYSVFYEAYRAQYWWVFVPSIAYMFAKGVVLAAGDGHGRAQTIAQLVIEAALLALLVWSRPYERRSGNVVNMGIQVVRVLSVVCVLVFVEEFGIAQTTQTVAGVVLVAVQAALSGVLALLIAWNAVAACVKENPHRKRRKAREAAAARDQDTLTPLDARNSLLQLRRATADADEKLLPPPSPSSSSAALLPVPGPRTGHTRQAASTASATSALSMSSVAVPIGFAPGLGGGLDSRLDNRSSSSRNLLQNRAPMGQLDAAAPAAGSGAVDGYQPGLAARRPPQAPPPPRANMYSAFPRPYYNQNSGSGDPNGGYSAYRAPGPYSGGGS